MATNIIKIKRTTGATAPSTLNAGELAFSGATGTQSNMLSSAAVEVTNVSEPDVPMYNAGVLTSEVDLFASTINTELAVVVPCT